MAKKKKKGTRVIDVIDTGKEKTKLYNFADDIIVNLEKHLSCFFSS